MWKRILLFGLLIIGFVQVVSAVNLDTNMTLRAICVDNAGTMCTDSTAWTVISPNGTTLYNQTAGVNSAYGISNFTVWLNQSGTYFVYANFSGHNISQAWNIIVEDYETDKISSVWSDVSMIAPFLLFGIIILAIMYAALHIGDEHVVFKWILVLTAIFMMPVAAVMVNISLVNTPSYTLTNNVVVIFIIILFVLFLYAFIYALFKLVEYRKLLKKQEILK